MLGVVRSPALIYRECDVDSTRVMWVSLLIHGCECTKDWESENTTLSVIFEQEKYLYSRVLQNGAVHWPVILSPGRK